MATSEKKKKRILTRFELILLIIALLIILSFALQRMGVDVIKKSEDSEIIQRPHD